MSEPYIMMGRVYIHTFSGSKMFYDDPSPCISIKDIAHALSNICRWTGHVKHHYSVAQHSVLVSKQKGGNITAARYKLLHDASEAYTGDVNKPLKTMLGKVFDDIEHKLQAAVWSHFGLLPPDVIMEQVIKTSDHEVSLAEGQQLFGDGARGLDISIPGVRPASVKIEEWSQERAEREFLDRFVELW